MRPKRNEHDRSSRKSRKNLDYNRAVDSAASVEMGTGRACDVTAAGTILSARPAPITTATGTIASRLPPLSTAPTTTKFDFSAEREAQRRYSFGHAS